MIAYSREEIFSATQIAKKFGEVLKKLGNRDISKAAISKNNEIEAVILPVGEYERMKAAADMAEMRRTGKRKSHFGSAKGQILMTGDFDDPLEDFKDYM
jgi:PHD/YefM family antitoxin component YafN of YafNO toxin-antitoxin module